MDRLFLLFDWAASHPVLLAKLTLVSVVLAVIYAAGIFFAIVRMSPDYFADKKHSEATWRRRHPLLRWLVICLKNIVGSGVMFLGIAMLVLPGQGILTILIGLTFLDFPGKRRLEMWIVRRPSICQGINRLRRRAGRPPLVLPDS